METPIIQVMFRAPNLKEFTNGPYTYICGLDVALGDLVLVNTKFGISLAQVCKINQKLCDPTDVSKLKEVVELCKTKWPLPLL